MHPKYKRNITIPPALPLLHTHTYTHPASPNDQIIDFMPTKRNLFGSTSNFSHQQHSSKNQKELKEYFHVLNFSQIREQ